MRRLGGPLHISLLLRLLSPEIRVQALDPTIGILKLPQKSDLGIPGRRSYPWLTPAAPGLHRIAREPAHRCTPNKVRSPEMRTRSLGSRKGSYICGHIRVDAGLSPARHGRDNS
jgi:hypothetical protein